MQQAAFLRHNGVLRAAEALQSDEFEELRDAAAHLLLRHARLCLDAFEEGRTPRSDANEKAVRDLSTLAALRPSVHDELGNLARELLVGLRLRRDEHDKALAVASRLLSGQSATKDATLEALHLTRAAYLTDLGAFELKGHEALNAITSAATLYQRVLQRKDLPTYTPTVLLHHGAACLELGKTRRRDASSSLLKATELAEAELTKTRAKLQREFETQALTTAREAAEKAAKEATAGGTGGGGRTTDAEAEGDEAAARAAVEMEAALRSMSKDGSGNGCSLDGPQLWMVRYLAGVTAQQDGHQAAALKPLQGAVTADDGQLSRAARIATYTALAVCQLQLGSRAKALESCEAAMRLGEAKDGGLMLFTKALLLAQSGRAEEAMATLRTLLGEYPEHLGGLLGLSTLLAEKDQLQMALGQAAAAREMANDPLALQQLGQLRMRIGVETALPAEVAAALLELEKAVDAHLAAAAPKGGSAAPPIACDAFVGLALAHMSSRKFEPALEELRKAARADLHSPIPLLFRAHVLLEASQPGGSQPGGGGGGSGGGGGGGGSGSRRRTPAVEFSEAAAAPPAEAAGVPAEAAARGSEVAAVDLSGVAGGEAAGPTTTRAAGGFGGGGGGGDGEKRPVGGISFEKLPKEAAKEFEAAAKAFARRVPEAVEECVDAGMRKDFFAASASTPLASLGTVLQGVKGREDALALAHCVHQVAVNAHRQQQPAAAATNYEFACRLAERAAGASKGAGGSQQARADALLGLIHLNRGRSLWEHADLEQATTSFSSALKAFERAKPLATALQSAANTLAGGADPAAAAEAPTLEGLVRRGAAAALYNLGAAQEALALTRQVVASQADTATLAAASASATAAAAMGAAAGVAAGAAAGAAFAAAEESRLAEVNARVSQQASHAFESAGRRAADACYDLALSSQPRHGGALMGRATAAFRKNRPRDAVTLLASNRSPSAAINRGVMLHYLGEDLDLARLELTRALESMPHSVHAAFNLAQLRMLRGEWCEPLASLEELSVEPAAIVESAEAAVSGTRATELAVIAPQLGPLLSACRKWQACLEIAAEDVRSSAQLVQPSISLYVPVADRCFASPVGTIGALGEAPMGGVAPEAERGPPLSAAQLSLLETLLAAADPRTADAPPPLPPAAPSAATADTATREQSPEQSPEESPERPCPQSPLLAAMAMQPAPLPPSLVSGAHRALALQAEGKMHQAERVLEGLLRSLTAPAIRPLGPTGALLYLWRSRSRRAVGRPLEADADLWLALAHVGVGSLEPPGAQVRAAIAADDEAAASAAAQAGALALKRRRELLASEAASMATAAAKATGTPTVSPKANTASDVLLDTAGEMGADAPTLVSVPATPSAPAAASVPVAARAPAAAEGGGDGAASEADDPPGDFPDLDNHEAVAAAAAVALPRSAWWACGLLLEQGAVLERAGELDQALSRYVAAGHWQPRHVIAAANTARLLSAEKGDVLGAAAECIRMVTSTQRARSLAAEAMEAVLGDDDDADEVQALHAAAACASDLERELIQMLELMRNGFASLPPDAGPPSEGPIARQQGRLAIAMDAERHRQKRFAEERAPPKGLMSVAEVEAAEARLADLKRRAAAGELTEEERAEMEALEQKLAAHHAASRAGGQSLTAAQDMRRRRVREATLLGGGLLGALEAKPSRLFDATDAPMTTMLWGMEQATSRVQAALGRAAAAAGEPKRKPRPSTAQPACWDAKRAGNEEEEEGTSGEPTAPRSFRPGLAEKMLRWGDDGQLHEGDIVNTPRTDKMVATSRQELTLGRFAVELESEQAKKEAKAMEQQQAKKDMEEPMRKKV